MDLPESDSSSAHASSPSSGHLVLSLVFLGYLLSYGDRFVFGLVLKPIKASLHLTDSQAGLLSGFAFAATYALFSPLAGYLVDRVSRKAIFIFAIAFWSCATFSCGLATTALSMGLARAAVGVGEALMIPLAVSVIGDLIALAKRARSFAFFFSGGPFGSLGVLLAGGVLLRHLGHRSLSLPFLGSTAMADALHVARDSWTITLRDRVTLHERAGETISTGAPGKRRHNC